MSRMHVMSRFYIVKMDIFTEKEEKRDLRDRITMVEVTTSQSLTYSH